MYKFHLRTCSTSRKRVIMRSVSSNKSACHFILEVLRVLNSCMNWGSAEKSVMKALSVGLVWRGPVSICGCEWRISHQKKSELKRGNVLRRVWQAPRYCRTLDLGAPPESARSEKPGTPSPRPPAHAGYMAQTPSLKVLAKGILQIFVGICLLWLNPHQRQ